MFPHGSMWRVIKKLRAEVAVNGTAVIPPLQYAWVIKVTREGIVISGTEYIAQRPNAKARVDSYPQTWWCRIDGGRLMQRLIGRPITDLDDEFEHG